MTMTQKLAYVAISDVSNDIKRTLIQQDMQIWRNTRFQTESRKRAYARANMPEQVKEQVEMLVKCEGILLDLEEQLNEIREV